jgi:Periplasmic protein TonB, links inner and outer membranes
MRIPMSIMSVTAYLLSFAMVSQGQNDSKAAIKAKLSSSTVSVISYDSNGDVLAHGAGFFVSEMGDVLTRGSLIPSEASRTQIKTPDGKTHDVKGIVAKDEKTGLVTVSLQNSLSGSKPLPSASFSPEFGDRVLAMEGYVNSEQKLIEGVVTGIDNAATGKTFRVAASLQSIASGSPVLNMKGEVVGVVISVNEGLQGFAAHVLSTEVSLYPRGASFQPTGAIREDLPSGVIRRTPNLVQGTAITKVAPSYPPVAKAQGVEGTVIVELLVGEDGSVLSARPLSFKFRSRSGNSEKVSDIAAEALKQAAVEAVLQWKFAPSMSDGKPVQVKGTLTLNFHL